MNAVFNPVDFIHRPEAEGIARGAAEAIAQGIEDRNRELATKRDLDRLATKDELQAALARQTVQFGAMLVAAIGLGTAILSAVIAMH